MKRMLPAFLNLLLVLAAVSHGTATFCDITETKTSVQCYGALGKSVFIHLLNTSFKLDGFDICFQNEPFFFRHIDNKFIGTCQNRCQLINNGTLRLDRAMKNDSGIYTIYAFDDMRAMRLKGNISLTIQGPATFCDITENKISVQCYGSLGRSVVIHPLNTSFDIYELKVFFQGKEFFTYKANRTPYNRSCQNRCQFMKNGTLRLNHVMKSDSGTYIIKEFDDMGRARLWKNVSLTIQDPVSPPALSQLCLSHGEIRASCNSTGEDPQYSWTLDDRPLDGGVALFSDETHTVILRRNVSGSITCTASNRVSSERTTQELLKCPGFAQEERQV